MEFRFDTGGCGDADPNGAGLDAGGCGFGTGFAGDGEGVGGAGAVAGGFGHGDGHGFGDDAFAIDQFFIESEEASLHGAAVNLESAEKPCGRAGSFGDAAAEQAILHLARQQARDEMGEAQAAPVLVTQQQVFAAQTQVLNMHMAPALEEYIVQLVLATRQPGRWAPELAPMVSFGASPRATIALDRCARACAWLDGRDYVSPDDIQSVAHDVFRHRVLLSYEAEADGVSVDQLSDRLLDLVPVP